MGTLFLTAPEFIPELIEETVAETVATVTEVIVTLEQYEPMVEYLNSIYAFMLFFVIVILCYFAYKFFRIFF